MTNECIICDGEKEFTIDEVIKLLNNQADEILELKQQNKMLKKSLETRKVQLDKLNQLKEEKYNLITTLNKRIKGNKDLAEFSHDNEKEFLIRADELEQLKKELKI